MNVSAMQIEDYNMEHHYNEQNTVMMSYADDASEFDASASEIKDPFELPEF